MHYDLIRYGFSPDPHSDLGRKRHKRSHSGVDGGESQSMLVVSQDSGTSLEVGSSMIRIEDVPREAGIESYGRALQIMVKSKIKFRVNAF